MTSFFKKKVDKYELFVAELGHRDIQPILH